MSSSSENDDDVNLPPAVECDRRCKEFAEITGTDTALAMFFLQDRDWSVERSVNDYFESTGITCTSRHLLSENTRSTAHGSESKLDVDVLNPVKSCHMEDDEPHRIRLLSWNIDGLDQGSLLARTKAVCETIKKERPHIIYLQEVVSETLSILQEKCSPAYRCIVGRHRSGEPTVGEYFVAMLLRNESVEYVSHNVLPFYTSQMGRCLLKVEATVKGVPCLLMTSHLESTGSHTAERKRQLKAAFDVMTKCDAQHTVIFGGDMNLRDKEVQQIGGLPRGVDDIWEATGRRQEAAYTWDTQRNDNLEWAHRFGPRCRFDRLFYRPNDRLTAVYFELVGLERLSSCRRFPSDHWGILAHFNKK